MFVIMPDSPLKKNIAAFICAEKGASLAEYAILVTFVAILMGSVVSGLGGRIGQSYNFTRSTIGEYLFKNNHGSAASHQTDLLDDSPDETGGRVQDFVFTTVNLNHDHDGRVVSEYVDIPGLSDTPREFLLKDGGAGLAPRATENVVGGGEGINGHLRWGTVLEAFAPDPGTSTVIVMEIGEGVGTWRISRDPAPEVDPTPDTDPDPEPPMIGAFDFGTRTLAWNDPTKRVRSDYIDIPGLDDHATAFTLRTNTRSGNPLAHSNVVDGNPASAGHLTWGTDISVDVPEPGQTIVAMLEISEEVGTFTVTREAEPSCPTLVLTQNNNKNHAQVNYSAQGVPHQERPFTLSGTGNSNPRAQSNSYSSGTDTNGMTAKWGINIQNDKLAKGQVETITLTICNQVIKWDVSR